MLQILIQQITFPVSMRNCPETSWSGNSCWEWEQVRACQIHYPTLLFVSFHLDTPWTRGSACWTEVSRIYNQQVDIIYEYNCCVCWPAFRYCVHLKAGQNTSCLWIKNHRKTSKINKKGRKQTKKVFQPAFGCMQHPKAGQNIQHTIKEEPHT